VLRSSFEPIRVVRSLARAAATLVGTTFTLAACGASIAPLVGCSATNDAQATPASGPCLPGITLSGDNCATLKEMLLPLELPASPGNAVADNLSAAQFGFEAFFSTRFSAGGVRCATCHSPEASFTDRLPVSKGVGMGTRNAPTIFTAPRMRWILWDGRADSLWSQPLFAFENKLEMGTTRLEIAHLLASDSCAVSAVCLKPLYEKVFGMLPDISDAQRFPARGAPGDAAFDNMAPGDQFTVNQIVANVGKALEAYMRKAATGRGAFDSYLLGDVSAIGDMPKRGIEAFFKAGCADCHRGPMLSDQEFHNVNLGPEGDVGRAAARSVLEKTPFTLDGPFSDGGPHYAPSKPPWFGEDSAALQGKFRTPTLRNVDGTWPYGHAGSFAGIGEVVLAHAPTLEDGELQAILSFLNTLRGSSQAPWDDWPRAQ